MRPTGMLDVTRSSARAVRDAPAWLAPRVLSALVALAALVALMALAGCKSPNSSFYTLSPDASLERTGAPLQWAVAVGPVTIPELVDRPQLVTRVSDNEVALNEFARWGEPLKSGIARTIAADLGQLLGSARVSVAGQAALVQETCRVRVDIVRFDSVPGDAVTVDAQWVVRVPGKPLPLSGRTVAREPVGAAG
ncbi:PqiC family protein, partial [Paraburkholderia solisilvae]|uniref:PqiC family protein n=1 Tax=Paraburkholderia solisilvae TaxID=624376 RepID=UPI001FEC4F75